MSDLDGFAAECKLTARNLRRIPKDLRRAIASEIKPEVAVPLAAKIGAGLAGPWASVLAGQVKARASAEPVIVVGGARRLVSGGASGRQLVYGAQFGGGKRTTVVAPTSRRRGYRLRSTRQFVRTVRPTIYPTIARNGEWVLSRFADVVGRVLEGVSDG